MEYLSTRNNRFFVDSAQAVLSGLAPDGGLYVPRKLPQIDVEAVLKMSTMDMAKTIIGALLLGVDRTTASKFTFVLAIPVMVGASAYKLLKFFLEAGTMTGPEIGYLLIGCAVAFAVSLVAIKFLMNFVKKHDFKLFGWYRIALGAVVIGALVIPQLLK